MTTLDQKAISGVDQDLESTIPREGSRGAEAAAGPEQNVSEMPAGLFFRSVDATAEAVLVIALLGELGMVLANVLARIFFHRSFLWTDEVARLALSTLAFIGGAVAYRRRSHAFVRVVLNLFSDRVQRVCFALADVLALLTAGITGVASIAFIRSNWSELTPILQVPAPTIAMPLTAGTALLVLYAFDHLRREHGRRALAVGGTVAVILAAAWITRNAWLPWLAGNTAISVTLALFFISIFAGLPVGFVLLLCTATYLWTADIAPMATLPQSMVNGTGNFIFWQSLLHLCRVDHGAGRHQPAAGALRSNARRPPAGRPPAGHGGQHVHRLRPVRLQTGGRGCRGHRDARPAARASRRGRGRSRPGGLGSHGRDGAAQYRHADRGVDHQRVGGSAFHRGLYPGGGDGRLPHGAHLCPGPPRGNASGRSASRSVRCSKRRLSPSPRC